MRGIIIKPMPELLEQRPSYRGSSRERKTTSVLSILVPGHCGVDAHLSSRAADRAAWARVAARPAAGQRARNGYAFSRGHEQHGPSMAAMAGHMYMIPLRSKQPGDLEKAKAVVAEVKATIERYKDYRKVVRLHKH